MSRKELLVIGIDGAIPDLVKLFSKKGVLPNITEMIEKGVIAEAYPCVPCDTPTNWTTLATGATTATHGATSFYLHVPGEPLDLGVSQRGRSQLSCYCRAEYFWDAAERNGYTPFVLNYPAGWPASFKKGAMSLFSWPTPESLPIIVSLEKTITTFEISPAQDATLPPGVETRSPPLETRLILEDILASEIASLKVLLIDSGGEGYDSILLFGAGGGANHQIVGKGEWSDEIEVPVETSYGVRRGVFRVRLEELTPDGESMVIHRTRILNPDGWTSPPDFGEKLVRNVLVKHDFSVATVEKRIPYDIYGTEKEYVAHNIQEADTLAKIVKHAKETIGWNMCYLHFHLLDSINHRYAAIYEGLAGDSEEVKQAREMVELSYGIVDDFVGTLVETCLGENTVVVFVSDHGAVPTYKTVNIALALMEEGLLSYKWSKNRERYVVDWSETLAFPYFEPPYVWVNLKGREPHGAVSPEDYDSVRERVIDCLYNIKENGRRVVALALKREDAAVLSQGGDRTGDVVYLLNPPYQVWDDRIEILNAAEMLPESLSDGLIYDSRQIYGAHAYYLPTARRAKFSVSSTLIVSGKGVNEGLELKKPVSLIDVVPTLAEILGIPPPKDCEGKVLTDLIA
ncbi:MAG: alkaline phosphatase family protein [Candidatus Freyarchaeota archaeon]